MDKDFFLAIYKKMALIRTVEEKIAAEYSDQEMRCPVHLSIGQEAVPAVISSILSKDDHAVSAHRSHAHYLAKGGDLKAMIGELYGKLNGCAKGKGGSMHLIDLDPDVNFTAAVPIVGSSISIGVGIGFGLSLSQPSAKVVVYFGDGATEEGVFSESLDYAALHNLPVLFVCENNFFSVYTPLDQRQSSNRDLQKIADGHDICSWHANGNNVLEVLKKSKQAIEYMEENEKPALVVFDTFRWLEHCGPNWDDHLGYRPQKLLNEWLSKCPLRDFEQEVAGSVGIDGEALEAIRQDVVQIVDEAFQKAKQSPFPNEQELFNDIYAV